MTIEEARERIIKEFKDNPDFRQLYVDNIACVIMDNAPGYKRDKEKRNKLADKILKWILGQKKQQGGKY